jgi:CspA family cold shock protein
MKANGTLQGKVKWFSSSKGFGFIEMPDHAGDVFVHYSGIQGSGYRQLQAEQRVEYELIDTDKGKQAVNVRVVG